MTSEDYVKLSQISTGDSKVGEIKWTDFSSNSTDRTLLYGYTVDRETVHVYLHTGYVRRIVYNERTRVLPEVPQTFFTTLDSVVPNKRLYPEACDYDFCAYLKRNGVHLPFTTFNQTREPEQFHGEVI